MGRTLIDYVYPNGPALVGTSVYYTCTMLVYELSLILPAVESTCVM